MQTLWLNGALICDESNARISTPSIIAVPEYPLQNTNIDELERNRASSKKSNWMSDRDPPSDESKCDYLDPLDLNFNQLHDIYIARSNHYQSKQTNWPSNNESTVITYA
ncbi:unnamed protein product [Acanthocheilonema viteae]|uniref:Uncharacterized protein n=1 Tax=Acanthocheilonema viteae TaxID=6277 RepID=A0A498SLD0_ACAVI|nr:unnamed protein product [Acanthocheilonema viteae]